MSSLNTSPAKRRERSSSSFSEELLSDDNIQATNDEASACKLQLAQLGYLRDPYIDQFVRRNVLHPEQAWPRKPPEISRGYWARVAAIRILVEKFIDLAGPSCQIISLGAGFDTLFWLLADAGREFARFVECDFPTVPHCLNSAGNTDQRMDLHTPQYHLVGADLRCLPDVKTKLDRCGANQPDVPTLVLAECVLIYMSVDQSQTLIQHFSSSYDTVCFVNYEQVNIDDKFGSIMQSSLHQHGVCLAGVKPCHSLESQNERFRAAGYVHSNAWNMNQIYERLPSAEVKRVEQLEFLDERELLVQLLQHYCIVVASKDAKNIGLEKFELSG